MEETMILLTPMLFFCSGDHQKISEAIGNMIGKDLQGISIDYDAFVQGMKEGRDGKDSPMSMEECLQVLNSLMAETNLKEAEDFLAEHKEKKGVVSLEEGKILYQVDAVGSGEVIQSYDSPLVRYEGRMLKGASFVSSEEEVLSLDQVIEGLRKGISGMREGEKRTIYIHPEFGFGADDFNMPNALLIFEVEIKARASQAAISSDLAETKEGC